METIVNKVAASGIETIDLAAYLPQEDKLASFDLTPFLFREMILKEKDYREVLKSVDWSRYHGKHTAIHCTADAIIPVWAFMLAAAYLQPVAASVFMGTPEEMKQQLIRESIAAMDIQAYTGKRVVIKGCGDKHIPDTAYVGVTAVLLPVVQSLMYGEPCSTVPVYKRR